MKGTTPELIESVKELVSSKFKSAPQKRISFGRMPSGPWGVPGLKLAECHAKDTIDRTGLFPFCVWSQLPTVAAPTKEAKN